MEKLIIILTLIFIKPLYGSLNDNLKEMIAEAISDPPKFFYELKNDSEITLPVEIGKSYSLNTNLFPQTVPSTYLNTSITYKIYREGELGANIPQIDITGGGSYMFGGKILSNTTNDIEDLKVYGYHIGVILTSSRNLRTRMFYGFKHSFLSSKLTLTQNKKHQILGVEINNFNSGFIENSLIIGVENLKDINKHFSVQLNYGLTNNTIAVKFSWYGKWFELGINVYPEGVIFIHPVWSMRLGF